jgi:hypothetical protein
MILSFWEGERVESVELRRSPASIGIGICNYFSVFGLALIQEAILDACILRRLFVNYFLTAGGRLFFEDS